ncbi:MAG: alanine racemase [Gammaproteobacteria bacterium]|nr:alanine racemase [Gammaproteobacteria bacterium]
MRRVSAEVDSAALAHNLNVARRCAPGSRVFAIVKADAYGHDLMPAARALDKAGADGFGVACVEEALELLEAGIRSHLLVLEGATSPAELDAARQAGLELVVHADWQLRMLELEGHEGLSRVWIKFDTGMHRLGFAPHRAGELHQRFDALGIEAAPISHLACADEPEREENRRQLQQFEKLREYFPGPASLANSAAVLALPAGHYDWVRPGIMLYGISPQFDRDGSEFGLRPAMTLKAHVLCIQDVAIGEGVGYGETWRAERPSRVATVSIGYGDGYPWRGATGASALLRDQRVPLVGRVSMDMLGIDVTDVPDAMPRDEVVLWGEGLPVESVARAADTIPYELVCDVTGRVPRIYTTTHAPVDTAAI